MARMNWRKALMMNRGKPDSGTQTAVTLGNNFSEIKKEVIRESEIANSYETQSKCQFVGITIPSPPWDSTGIDDCDRQ